MVKVLFVCMGNICRSPSGEAVMNKFIKRANLSESIQCDSAGTIAFHEGEPADARMKRHAIKRGYRLTSIARRFRYEDFENYDYIIAMDRKNYDDLISFDENNSYKSKVFMMTDFAANKNYKEVPDPYYGGPEGFEQVIDIIEESCEGLLERIKSEI